MSGGGSPSRSKYPPSLYRELIEFHENRVDLRLTARQRELLEVGERQPFQAEAAATLGIARTTYNDRFQRILTQAVARGFTPELPHAHKKTVAGFSTKRISTHTDKEGNTSGWHIQEPTRQEIERLFVAYCQSIIEDTITPPPAEAHPALETNDFNPDLLAQLFIGDGHFGMYAWGEETGAEDFDTVIASRDLRHATDVLFARAPNAETIVIANVGDFIHMSNTLNTTLKGTVLDVDTRMPRVMDIAGRTLRYIVDEALKRFRKVILINVRGNHDDNPAIGLSMALEYYYENNPRVTVPQPKGYFHYLEWGKWLWGYNHGDKVKHQKLGDVMARDMSEAWGRTAFRWWITGHFHKDHLVTLDNGCKVKICNPLVPPDGWHASMGYGGEQSMELTTFKKQGGVDSTFVHNIVRPRQAPQQAITL